jgi:hypothetical protein
MLSLTKQLLNTENIVETTELISKINSFLHANKRNSSPEYDSLSVIEFLSSDSKDFDTIVENILPDQFLTSSES